jgi:hypothetical protein
MPDYRARSLSTGIFLRLQDDVTKGSHMHDKCCISWIGFGRKLFNREYFLLLRRLCRCTGMQVYFAIGKAQQAMIRLCEWMLPTILSHIMLACTASGPLATLQLAMKEAHQSCFASSLKSWCLWENSSSHHHTACRDVGCVW